jgi:acetyl-CoA acetyltransferase
MSTARKAAVVGVYTTEQGKRLGRTKVSLEVEAVKGALADAGLPHTAVDGLSPLLAEPWSKTHMYWAEQLGGRPITYIGTGQGEGAVAKAAAAVSAGTCSVAVAWVAHVGGGQSPGTKTVSTSSAPRLPDFHWDIQGAYMTPLYALWAQRYMYEFGATSEDLAQVAVIHRDHAVLNPDSIMGRKGPITVEDVVTSRMIADPLHLLDCSIENDGGYALVIAAEEIARDCRKAPVWVLGGAEATATDVYASFHNPWFPEAGAAVRRCTDMAFGIAGVQREDIDVANLYDCFTITMLRNLEEMGFCKIGEAAGYVREGHTRLGGSMPCNTDGGLLSNSHNTNPSGMSVIEIVRQLRGECGPRQVEGARLGLALGQGGSIHGLASTVILARD